MDFDVREARLEDAAAIAAVHNASWRETYSGRVPESFLGEGALERRTSMWTRLLTDPGDRRAFVVRDGDGAIVGFAASGPSHEDNAPRELELYMIYLLATAHGSGAGQRLLDAVLGDRPAMLWVAQDNPRASAFYAKNGFVDDGTRKEEPGLEGFVHLRLVR